MRPDATRCPAAGGDDPVQWFFKRHAGNGARPALSAGRRRARHDFGCGCGGSSFWTLARTVLSVCTRVAICT